MTSFFAFLTSDMMPAPLWLHWAAQRHTLYPRSKHVCWWRVKLTPSVTNMSQQDEEKKKKKTGKEGGKLLLQTVRIFSLLLYKELLCGERARWEIHERWKDFSMATCSCACTSQLRFSCKKKNKRKKLHVLLSCCQRSWYREQSGQSCFLSIHLRAHAKTKRTQGFLTGRS